VELYPNGPYVSLGSGRELFHEFAENDRLSISCQTSTGNQYSWEFFYNESDYRLITAHKFEREDLQTLSDLKFSYLCAERWGPRVTYPYEQTESEGLGIFGQYAIRHLIDHGEDAVENIEAHHPNAKGTTLIYQVQAWLGEISPGVRLDVKHLREAGLSVAGFGFERQGDVASRYYRPTNVGFGLTYSLPLIVSLLAAKPDSIILLENPEAHLHPRGQTQLARLIALVSKKVQVIVETHSDHLMNGLRVAVKRNELPTGNVAFHYFRRDGVTSRRDTPEIGADGRLSFWPDGFFDEHERTLAALVRRPRS
jgi:predicted ATPase